MVRVYRQSRCVVQTARADGVGSQAGNPLGDWSAIGRLVLSAARETMADDLVHRAKDAATPDRPLAMHVVRGAKP